jgi:two-component system, response regulator PdtaR
LYLGRQLHRAIVLPPVPVKPLRIAIAEDNWFVAEHLRSELVMLGHTVVGMARTGEELIEVAARERPHVALVDIRLAAGSDGLAAAKEIQERFGIPAIAATGHLTAGEARAAGLLGLLSKPHSLASLRMILEATMEWLESGTTRPFLVR